MNKRSQTEPDLSAEPEVVATTTGENKAVNNNDNGDEDGNVPVAASSSSEDEDESRPQSVGSGVRRQNANSCLQCLFDAFSYSKELLVVFK